MNGFRLISIVEKSIRARQLFKSGDTLVAGLSGGADSIALLDILSALPGYNLHLVAAHLNHCLRGHESDADQEFCRQVASRYNIPFETERVDIKKIACVEGLNLEDAGRRARIAFFDDIACRHNASAVVLAHHADDQAETLLMHLLRGAGVTGLSGMAHRNARGCLRPLLDIRRTEIEEYLHARGLTWREDASNKDTAYLRNRVRHDLLPLLEGYNPAIRSCLAATAALLKEEDELLAELTVQEFKRSCRMEEDKAVFSVTRLAAINAALGRRLLRHALKQLVGTLEGIGQRHIEAILDLVASGRPNSRLELPHGVVVLREYDKLILTSKACFTTGTDSEILIDGPGSYQLPWGGSIAVTFADAADISGDPDTALFDGVAAPFPWHVRTFRHGDRMVPLGMSGTKKVKDIFIDKKIPQSERVRVPLLLSDNNVMWLAGVCRSWKSRIQEEACCVVKASFTRP